MYKLLKLQNRNLIYCQNFKDIYYYYYTDRIEIITVLKLKTIALKLLDIKIKLFNDTITTQFESNSSDNCIYNTLITDYRIIINTSLYDKNLYASSVFCFFEKNEIDVGDVSRFGWENYYYLNEIKYFNIKTNIFNFYEEDKEYQINYLFSNKIYPRFEFEFESVIIKKCATNLSLIITGNFNNIITMLEIVSAYCDNLNEFQLLLIVDSEIFNELNISNLDKLDILKLVIDKNLTIIKFKINIKTYDDFSTVNSLFFVKKSKKISYAEYLLKFNNS